MKCVATLSADFAQEVAELLRVEGIPSQTRANVNEGGLEMIEILAPDNFYEKACAIAESWHERELRRRAELGNWRCPKCRSPHLVFVGDENHDNVYRCRDCGTMVFAR